MIYKENIFTKILNREVATDIIWESEHFISFKDINPVADVHILVIPKKHYVNYKHFVTNGTLEEKLDYHHIINELIDRFQLENFKLVTNNGAKAGQVIFHFHTHIMGYRD